MLSVESIVNRILDPDGDVDKGDEKWGWFTASFAIRALSCNEKNSASHALELFGVNYANSLNSIVDPTVWQLCRTVVAFEGAKNLITAQRRRTLWLTFSLEMLFPLMFLNSLQLSPVKSDRREGVSRKREETTCASI